MPRLRRHSPLEKAPAPTLLVVMRRDRQRLCQLHLGKPVLVRLDWAEMTQQHAGHLHEVNDSSVTLAAPVGEGCVQQCLHLPLRAIALILAYKATVYD